jgi:hypothetical protein
MATSQLHEDFSREEHVKAGSDRSFGFVFAGFFGILSAINLWHHGFEDGAAWKWMLHAGAQEVLAEAADHDHDGGVRRPDRADQGLGRGAAPFIYTLF